MELERIETARYNRWAGQKSGGFIGD